MRPRSQRRSFAVSMLAGALALALVVPVAGLAGCGPGGRPGGTDRAGDTGSLRPEPSAATVELLVLGAASLRDVLADLARAYEAEHPGTRITLATDGSDALRARIEEGLQGDVFVSADAVNPARLVDAGLVLDEPVTVARNELAIAVSLQARDLVRSPLDLARPGLRIVAAGPGVPITAYVEQALERLAALDGYPADLADRVESNVVSREDNVRAALAKVILGEGDAAFVYATDVIGRDDIETVALPRDATVEAEYVAVALSGARQPGAAHDLVAWLRSSEAQARFASRGFGRVDG